MGFSVGDEPDLLARVGDTQSARQTAPAINGVALHDEHETPAAEELRQRACSELLRQAAIRTGLLLSSDPLPLNGVMTQAASDAIETLLDRELDSPAPDDDACRRYFDAHAAKFTQGERARVRHVLFAVTPGVDVNALRKRAEACLLDLRCEITPESTRFAEVAASTSNCPSGADGGHLGWLQERDCAPEFAREIFGKQDAGVLSRLVHSRFGLHVVEVLAREPGVIPPYEVVREAVAQTLERQRFTTSLRQYLQLLAGQAVIRGIELDASDSPLVQ
jgi:peptidyl-prolyl cis-trans isomerase C